MSARSSGSTVTTNVMAFRDDPPSRVLSNKELLTGNYWCQFGAIIGVSSISAADYWFRQLLGQLLVSVRFPGNYWFQLAFRLDGTQRMRIGSVSVDGGGTRCAVSRSLETLVLEPACQLDPDDAANPRWSPPGLGSTQGRLLNLKSSFGARGRLLVSVRLPRSPPRPGIEVQPQHPGFLLHEAGTAQRLARPERVPYPVNLLLVLGGHDLATPTHPPLRRRGPPAPPTRGAGSAAGRASPGHAPGSSTAVFARVRHDPAQTHVGLDVAETTSRCPSSWTTGLLNRPCQTCPTVRCRR